MIFTVIGARPNYIKAAPIHDAFQRLGVEHALVHTGQHYDAAMSKVFFEDLKMPRPAINLGVGSGSHAEQTAAVMIGLERYFMEHRPRGVLVVGDINSTMAAAIVCAKMGIYCAHVEAGLRSGDWAMPEEINRIITDSVCDLLLTPSPDADANLLAEGCTADSIVRVGNVMIDTLLAHLPRARELHVAGRLGLADMPYGVVTLHRPSNVDDPDTLRAIVKALIQISERLPVVFPVHPRTRKQLSAAGLDEPLRASTRLQICDPLGYLEFMSLTSGAHLVLTDSGGLQEETTVLGIPCLTLRDNTERPITIDQGTNVLVGNDPDKILAAADRALTGTAQSAGVPDLWDGKTAGRIADAVLQRIG